MNFPAGHPFPILTPRFQMTAHHCNPGRDTGGMRLSLLSAEGCGSGGRAPVAAGAYSNTTDCTVVISIVFPQRGLLQRTLSSRRRR